MSEEEKELTYGEEVKQALDGVLTEDFYSDIEKFFDRNNVRAGKRIRKSLLDLDKVSKSIRKHISGQKIKIFGDRKAKKESQTTTD